MSPNTMIVALPGEGKSHDSNSEAIENQPPLFVISVRVCGDALTLGQEGAACEACESPHHARCWDDENGCGETGCINAPLRQDPNLIVVDELFWTSETRCSFCGEVTAGKTNICTDCQRFQTASDPSQRDRETADEALQAFLLGIFSAFVPPLLSFAFYDHYQSKDLGLFTPRPGRPVWQECFQEARVAKNQISHDQTLKGTGLATAAQIIGLGGIALTILAGLAIFPG